MHAGRCIAHEHEATAYACSEIGKDLYESAVTGSR